MASYLGIQGFVEKVGEAEVLQIAGVGGWNGPDGRSIDEEKIGSALAFADDLISGYVLSRHGWLADAEAADIPDLLKGVAVDITRYRLRDLSNDHGEIDKTVERRYRDAIRTLEGVRSGMVELLQAGGGDAVVPASGADRAEISGPPPRAPQILEGWR